MWIERLLAEALGRDGTGLVPIADEPIGDPVVYGADRALVALVLAGDTSFDDVLDRLDQADHPVIRIDLGVRSISAGSFRWEMAAATAGAVFGINPFDAPAALCARERTTALLSNWRRIRGLPDWPAEAEEDGVEIMTQHSPRPKLVAEGLGSHLAQAEAGDYVAVQAYIPPSPDTWRGLQALRVLPRDRLRIATTVAFGPRHLSAMGRRHKGGRPNGLFIQIVGEDKDDLAIPGADYGFSTLKAAQALGDLEALREAGCRVIRLRLAGGARAGTAAGVADRAHGDPQALRKRAVNLDHSAQEGAQKDGLDAVLPQDRADHVAVPVELDVAPDQFPHIVRRDGPGERLDLVVAELDEEPAKIARYPQVRVEPGPPSALVPAPRIGFAEAIAAERLAERLGGERTREQAVEDPAARGRLGEPGGVADGEHAIAVRLGERPKGQTAAESAAPAARRDGRPRRRAGRSARDGRGRRRGPSVRSGAAGAHPDHRNDPREALRRRPLPEVKLDDRRHRRGVDLDLGRVQEQGRQAEAELARKPVADPAGEKTHAGVDPLPVRARGAHAPRLDAHVVDAEAGPQLGARALGRHTELGVELRPVDHGDLLVARRQRDGAARRRDDGARRRPIQDEAVGDLEQVRTPRRR